MEINRCKGNVRELLALELFARGLFPGPSGPLLAKNRPKGRFFGRSKPPGPRRANRLRAIKQTISASLVYDAERVPGQRKPGSQPKNECIHFSVCLPGFRGAPRRPTGKAGRPGTVIGVKTSWRKLSQQERRQTQVSLHSFLFLKKARIPCLFRGNRRFCLKSPFPSWATTFWIVSP